MCQIQYFEPYPYDLVNIFHPQHTPIGLKARWPKKACQQLGGVESTSINPFDAIHVLAHGFPGATLHPAKAKEHNSMRFTKFRQESGPQESGQDAVMVSFSGAVMVP